MRGYSSHHDHRPEPSGAVIYFLAGGASSMYGPTTFHLPSWICDRREASLPRRLVGEKVAGAGSLALVPLSDPWAVRRFVIASRPEQLRSASARLLSEYLQAVLIQNGNSRLQCHLRGPHLCLFRAHRLQFFQ